MSSNVTLPGFDADTFRSQIRFAMNIGLPDVNPPTFYWPTVKTYPAGTRLDTEGVPLDPRIVATVSSPTPIQVPCAVEFKTTNNDDENLVGTFRQTAATLTLLDQDYAQIVGATEVALGGVRYNIAYQSPPIAMQAVTVYQLHCFPKQEVI